MGECPDWYPLLKAAKWLGVPPWELVDQPQVWMEWALIADAAESDDNKLLKVLRALFGG